MEAGEAWSDHGGGTSGALWGGALLAAGQSLDQATEIGPNDVAAAFGAALQAVIDLGQAAPGDKTMLDALQPFCLRLRADLEADIDLGQALQNAANASLAAAIATADQRPQRGRARPHAYCLLAATQPAT